MQCESVNSSIRQGQISHLIAITYVAHLELILKCPNKTFPPLFLFLFYISFNCSKKSEEKKKKNRWCREWRWCRQKEEETTTPKLLCVNSNYKPQGVQYILPFWCESWCLGYIWCSSGPLSSVTTGTFCLYQRSSVLIKTFQTFMTLSAKYLLIYSIAM